MLPLTYPPPWNQWIYNLIPEPFSFSSFCIYVRADDQISLPKIVQAKQKYRSVWYLKMKYVIILF